MSVANVKKLILLLLLVIPAGSFAMAEKPNPVVGYDGFVLDADVSPEEMQAQAEYLAKKYNYDLDKLIAVVKRDNPKAYLYTGAQRETFGKGKILDWYGLMIVKHPVVEVRYVIQFETDQKSKKVIKVTATKVIPGL